MGQLQWLLIRNNSSFLMKRNDATFTKEPNNLKNKNSYRFNGLIHNKTVGVEAAEGGKGVVLVTKKAKCANKPGKQMNRAALKGSSRAVLSTISRTIRKNRYRKDLKMAAMRRAAAILKSQKVAADK